ncbi:L,D-transpeptidase [Candidatus Parcubacteria bacterium]|nr:L,D-transpeptidase [Candidatus Parcubacteria bacterium]
MAFAVGLIVGVAWEALGLQALPRLEYRVTPEVGEEVVVSVGPGIHRAQAERAFRLSPPVRGQTEWDEAARALHFFPLDGFKPGQVYTLIWSGPGSLLARIVPEVGASFRAEPQRLASSVEPEPVSAPTPLPPSGDQVLTKHSGERVMLDPPRVRRGKSIEINLSLMTLQMFENGQRVAAFETAGKGNPKTTPTPTGRFKILRKRGLMLSNLSYVWMPYSMQFSGPYYLHGLPYYQNGRMLTTQYSGGCVRMPKGVDQTVYNWAQVGTAVVISGA